MQTSATSCTFCVYKNQVEFFYSTKVESSNSLHDLRLLNHHQIRPPQNLSTGRKTSPLFCCCCLDWTRAVVSWVLSPRRLRHPQPANGWGSWPPFGSNPSPATTIPSPITPTPSNHSWPSLSSNSTTSPSPRTLAKPSASSPA